MDIAFLKQGVRSYGQIEAGIERAAAQVPGLRLASFDYPALFFAQPAALGKPGRHREALKALLPRMLADPTPTLLLLNGFVPEQHHPGFFAALRAGGKRVVSWQIDDPYYIDMNRRLAAHLDVVLTVDSSALPVYRELGKKAAFLPLGCDPHLHRRYPPDPQYASDVCFVGTPFAGSRRIRLIEEAAECLLRHDTKLVGGADIDSWAKNLERFDVLKPLILDARVPLEAAARYFSGARINLNIHKDSYGHPWDRNAGKLLARSPAERTFAVAGCGGFQLMDDTRPDLAQFFEPGKEVVTFSDAADLVEKIDYYLGHEAERAAIAGAAQARAAAEHTYLHRLRFILDLL